MITVVSGLPRSGTSLMMQMLTAGGLPSLTDGLRVSDINNPRGYFEWEKIKQLGDDPACIAEAEGKAVKVISALLRNLPSSHSYRVIFMNRSLQEVVASQGEMIQRLGAAGPSVNAAAMMVTFETHLRQIAAWLDSQENITVCRIQHRSLLAAPREQAMRVQEFLGLPLDVGTMASQVDVSLHRQRSILPGAGSEFPAVR